MRTVISLHPEELLDRDARGLLSPAERARLDDHLAQCAACRLERQLRDDFADELGSDVTPSAIERLTLASVSQPRREVTPPPPPLVATVPPPRRRVARAAWLLAAAAVFAVSAASASASNAVRKAWSQIVGAPEAPTTVAAASAPRVVARHASVPGDARANELSLPREVPSTDVLVAPPPPVVARVVRHAARPQVDPASALFEEATEARRQGDYARALTLQRDLQARFPRSREAHVSRATLGRLLLDRGDPSAALTSFDAYLGSGSGDLGEEAMIGRATALERLGRTFEAAHAWQALLAAYPQTSYAAHARARLGGPGVR